MQKCLQKRLWPGHRHRTKGIHLSDEICEKNGPNLSILYEIFYGNRDRLNKLAIKICSLP